MEIGRFRVRMARIPFLRKSQDAHRPVDLRAELIASDALFVAVRLTGVGSVPPVAQVRGEPVAVLAEADGWLVPVPGWIWAGEPATVVCTVGGGAAEIALDRADMSARLADIAQTPVDAAADYALVNALEHADHGGFLTDMPESVQRYFVEAARLCGLSHILPPGMAAAAREESGEPASATWPLLARLGRAVRAAGDATAPGFLRDLLEEYDLSRDDRLALILDLTPQFCRIGIVGTLYDIVLPDEGAASVEPDWDNAWRLSLALPARMLCEDIDAVQAIMKRLAAEPQNAVSTPAVAWVMRRLLDHGDPLVPFHLFEGILRAGLALIDSRASAGRGGMPCAALRMAAVALLGKRWMCSDRLQGDLAGTLIRAFGASPAFWAEADRVVAAQDLPADLAACRRAFTRMSASLGQSDPTVQAALRPLRDMGVYGADRMQREVLGPLRMGHLPAQPMQALGRTGAALGADLLRGYAAPFAPVPEPGHAGALAEAARAAYGGLPRSDTEGLQRRTLTDATGLIAAAREMPGQPDADRIAGLAAGLTRLSGMASGSLGLGVTLAVVQDLETARADAWADLLSRHMAPIFDRVTRNAGEALADAPGLVTAARRLQAPRAQTRRRISKTPDGPSEAAARLLNTLPLQDQDTDGAGQFAKGTPADWPGASALFDTLVVVYSCQANLEDRVPALRATWLRELEKLGIPHVVLVGGDRTGLDGDILTVEAPDDYENLPAKTLKMVDWVFRNSGFGHLLKIDDDCYLDPAAYFLDHTYRRHVYYGRRLEKRDALIDRTWHQGRSTSAGARLSFEKLPRHAVYADGGTGYVLNRTAMRALLDQLDTLEGRALATAAYSEDKLVGALLMRAGIEVREMSCHTAVHRRAAPDAPAVPQWVSGLLPNRLGVTKLAHLDAGADMAAVQAGYDDLRPRPARIWPTHRAPALGFNSGALHLLSGEDRLARAAQAEVAVVSVVRNEARMLPHFLSWYRSRGVNGFLIADNGSEDGTLNYLLAQPDVAVFTADTEFRAVDQGTDWKIALLAHYRLNRWSLIADADELLLYPGYLQTTLPAWLRRYRFSQTDAVGVRMLDLYPDGPLAGADPGEPNLFAIAGFTDRRPFLADSLATGPYDNGTTWTSAVRHRLMPGMRPELFVAQKVPLLRYRPWMRLSTSLHYAADVTLADDSLLFAHFKYHADFAAKARREIERGQYYNNAEEYRRYLALVAEGRDSLFDPSVSVPWDHSEAVRVLLDDGSRGNTG